MMEERIRDVGLKRFPSESKEEEDEDARRQKYTAANWIGIRGR
jgi:hypothetical protein